jgi:erythromycin esterase
MKRTISCEAILGIALVLFYTSVASQAQSDSGMPQLAQEEDLAKDARVKWLKRNAVGVRSVDPKDEDFHDLMPLKKVLRNVQIVMLGESTHGDGATFLGKTRLIKFLHQKMGFDVLVFESGLYEMSKVWESFRQGDHSLAALQQGLFTIWSGSDQIYPLFDYVVGKARTERPLELAGFDSQISGSASRKQLIKDLEAFLNEIGINTDLLIEGSSFRAILEDVIAAKEGTPVPSPAEQDAYLRRLEQLEKDVTARGAGKNNLRIGF